MLTCQRPRYSRRMKIGLREIHHFITKTLPERLLTSYGKFRILSERDLQVEVALQLRRFLRHDQDKKRLALHNCLFCKDPHTYPDIVILKRGEPWILIELKETKKLDGKTARNERRKIRLQRDRLPTAKRGYLLYLARYGKHRVLLGKKGRRYGFWFYEIPVTLERQGEMPKEEINSFNEEFRSRAKYASAR